MRSNQENKYGWFLYFLLVSVLSYNVGFTQNTEIDQLTKILKKLQNRQNSISSIEYTLSLSGKTLPLFENEEEARKAAEIELEKLHQRKGDMDRYRESEAYQKDLKNNTRVFMQGYTPSSFGSHKFRIVGLNNLLNLVASDTNNEIEQILGRFAQFEADFNLSNGTIKMYPRTNHLRASTPLFYYETILDASSFLKLSIQEETQEHIVIKAIGQENSRFHYITYFLTLNKMNFLPKSQIESYSNPHQSGRDWKREIEYQDYTTDSNTYSYPKQIKETNWNIQPPLTVIKPWIQTTWTVQEIQLNHLSMHNLDFEVPQRTFVVNQFSPEANSYFKTDNAISIFTLAKQLKIIP